MGGEAGSALTGVGRGAGQACKVGGQGGGGEHGGREEPCQGGGDSLT